MAKSFARELLDALNEDEIEEDACANAAGNGGVAGIGVGPKGEPGVKLPRKKHVDEDEDELEESLEDTAAVFEVDSDRFHKARHGKNRYHRWSRYVGEDELGQKIREVGKSRKKDIVLKDGAKGPLMFFARRKASK